MPAQQSQTIERLDRIRPFLKRRKALRSRRQGGLLDIFVADAGFRKDSTDAQLYDFGPNGLGLWLFQPFPSGMKLQVGIPNGRRPEDWDAIFWVKVQVQSCRRQHLGWIVDCQFTETPPDSLFSLMDQLSNV